MADIERFSNADLRAIATRNLVECCDDCRVLLREQLEDEEQRDDRWQLPPDTPDSVLEG